MTDFVHLSVETLDLLNLGALSPEDTGEARKHLQVCSQCKAAAAQLEEDARYFNQVVLARTLPSVHRRLESGGLLFRLKGLFARLAALFAREKTRTPVVRLEK